MTMPVRPICPIEKAFRGSKVNGNSSDNSTHDNPAKRNQAGLAKNMAMMRRLFIPMDARIPISRVRSEYRHDKRIDNYRRGDTQNEQIQYEDNDCIDILNLREQIVVSFPGKYLVVCRLQGSFNKSTCARSYSMIKRTLACPSV